MATSLSQVFRELIRIDDEGRATCQIDEEGFLTYFYDSPQLQVNVTEKLFISNSDTQHIYVLPFQGDLLLNVTIDGDFKNAQLYQYDWTGSRKCIYAELDKPGTMAPFPYSGIPLLQCGKAFYISIDSSDIDSVEIVATYAFLEKVSRKKLAQYSDLNSQHENGVKIKHLDGTIYQAYGVRDSGFSPNYLGPIE